ncbi:IucA/IucC family protein [Streptomyces coeruleorubidus]|uniref:IucA/IucC family protein n=1 Tax=Streptomyces coeruleorubidus TaxID=116188 RepID=UPI00364BCAD2
MLSALLREDVVGLRSRSTLVHRPDGPWLRRAAGPDALLLPVAEDGFQCAYAARLPLLRRASDGAELTSYADVLGVLRALAEPEDRAGFDAFAEECRQTLATLRLHADTRAGTAAELTSRHGADPACWTGLDAGLAFDALAARQDHPVYPTGRGRAGLAEHSGVDVVPTLSMRTVGTAADSALHLKVPLATSSLGLRNKRSVKPGTLVDGAVGQRLVQRIVAREPRFRDTILHADETTYAHAGHELLAVLCRRHPAGLADSVVVPMAALLAEAPDGRLVLDHLADRFHDGDTLALLDACLTVLFDATEVLDVKHSHGEEFAVLRGGTHHLRTPATKGHDQPCSVLPVDTWPHPWPRPSAHSGRVTLAGQLCTPKDVLARRVPVRDLRAGDRVVFSLAGAYAWNISHHDFLMHPRPGFHFLSGDAPAL